LEDERNIGTVKSAFAPAAQSFKRAETNIRTFERFPERPETVFAALFLSSERSLGRPLALRDALFGI
jgi:hypothetical protein